MKPNSQRCPRAVKGRVVMKVLKISLTLILYIYKITRQERAGGVMRRETPKVIRE